MQALLDSEPGKQGTTFPRGGNLKNQSDDYKSQNMIYGTIWEKHE